MRSPWPTTGGSTGLYNNVRRPAYPDLRLADNGAGGTTSRRDAGTQGTNASGHPMPYAEKTPWWLAAAASMCLPPGTTAVIKLFELSSKVDSFVESTVGAKAVTILQRGGNTIYRSTANALNRSTGMNLSAREWGRALESLKTMERVPNNFHGSIDSLGNYINPETGEVIGNVLDYLP